MIICYYGDITSFVFRKEVRFQLDPKTPFDIVIKELKLQCGFKREQQFTLKWLDIDGMIVIYNCLCLLYSHVRARVCVHVWIWMH